MAVCFMKKSMEQFVYTTITEAIVKRKLAPGTQLIEMSIAEQLNVSRTPVRNAIKRLENDGFINVIPNRGAFVIHPSLEEMAQAYFIRKELELISVREGFPLMTTHHTDKMSALIQQEKKALNESNIMAYLEINKQFHMVMANACGNKFLTDYLDKILNQIDLYLLIYNAIHELEKEFDTGWEEHTDLVEAIKTNDMEAYQSILIKHLDFSLEELKFNTMNYKPLANLF